MFNKERSSRLLTAGRGIRSILSPSQCAAIIVIIWTFFAALVFPVYREWFVIVQLVALYALIMDGITKNMDDHKE